MLQAALLTGSRRRALACALFLAAAGLFPGCEDGGSDAQSSAPPVKPWDFGDNDPSLVVAMGDSITAWGYPELLDAMTSKSVVNLGHGGDHSAEGVSQVDSVLGTHKPGYLLVLYGANDILHQRDPDSTIDNLRYMIRAASANHTFPVIGTLTPMASYHEIWNGAVLSLNTQIVSLASETGAGLADLHKAFEGHEAEYLGTDGLHPTATGSVIIATTFLNEIE